MNPLRKYPSAGAVRRDAPLRLELLEDRNLLSVSVLDNFESGTLDEYRSMLRFVPDAAILPTVAQDGRNTLVKQDGYEWIVRGSPAQPLMRQGQTLSVWAQFAEAADGRAYIGFGANPQRFSGTYSLVLAANTNQLMLQFHTNGYNHSALAAVPQSYEADHWYRAEVAWGVGGRLVGRLYDSDGVTLLSEVAATHATFNAGGIAFRAFGSNKNFHTVVQDDDSSAKPQELAEAGGGLLKGWEPQDILPPPANLDSGGTAPVPWAYSNWEGSNRDVELLSFNQLQYVATVNGRVGLAAGNVSRVMPFTSPIDWGPANYSGGTGTPPPETPLLAQYLFRQLPGDTTRLIGASDVKHFFSPSVLGPGETDAYGSGLNAIQSYYLPGSELDPTYGMMHRRSHFGALNPDGINLSQNHGHPNQIAHLLQVAVDDLDPALYPAGTRWFLAGNLWVAADQNVANNSRWLEVRPVRNGSAFSFTYPSGQVGQLNFRNIPDLYEPAGPFVLAQSPRGVVNGPVNRITVRFSTPIDVNTFIPDEVYLFDPEGNQISVNAVTPLVGSGDREFELTFDDQFTGGDYYFVLGIGILDLFGNPPDQDQNGIAGEDADWYVGGFSVAGRSGGSPTGGGGGGAEWVWRLEPAPMPFLTPVVGGRLTATPAQGNEQQERPAPDTPELDTLRPVQRALPKRDNTAALFGDPLDLET